MRPVSGKNNVCGNPITAGRFSRYKEDVRGYTGELTNGVPVLLETNRHTLSACVAICVNSGTRDEDDSNAGISHLIEHALFKGTLNGTNRLTNRQLLTTFEGGGGDYGAETDREGVMYYAVVPGPYAPLAAEALSTMVTWPAFPSRELEHEKTVVLGEFKTNRDNPEAYSWDLMGHAIWAGISEGLH